MILARWQWGRLLAATRLVMLWSTAVVVILAPCLYANGDDDFSGPLILLAAFQLLVVAAGIAASRSIPTQSPGPLTAGLLAWYGVCTLFSISPFHSVRVLSIWAGAVAIFFGIVAARPNPYELRRLSLFMVTGIAGLCLYGIVQSFMAGLGFRHAFSVTFSNSDCFGALVLMAVAVGIGLVPLSSLLLNHLLLVDLMILFAALVGTGSRAGLVGALVAGGIIGVRRMRSRGVSVRRTMTVIVAGLALSVVCAALIAGPQLKDRFDETFSKDGQQGWSVRAIVVRGFLHTLARSPVVGSGPGTFHLAFQTDRPWGLFDGYINQAHIDLVQIVVESGVVGLALFGALLVLAIVRGWKSRAAPSVIGPVAGLIGVTAYGLVNFAVPVPADLFWIFTLLALTFGYINSTKHVEPLKPEEESHQWCRGHVLACAVPLVLLLASMGAWNVGNRTMLGLDAASQADRLAKDHQWIPAILACGNAIAIEPTGEAHYAQRGRLLERLGQSIGRWSLIVSGRGDLWHALRLNPRAKGVRLQLALMLERWGDVQGAEQQLLEATRIYPQDSSPWQELAHIAAGRDDTKAAALDLWNALQNDHDLVRELGWVMAALESEHPSEGCALLRQFASDGVEQNGWALEVAIASAQQAGSRSPQAAEALIRTALDIAPSLAAARFTLATLQMRQGKPGEALDSIRQACEVTDQKLGAGVRKVVQEDGDGPLVGEMNLLKTYLSKNPNDNPSRVMLARLYIRTQQPKEAIQAYKVALDVDPEDATLYASLGELVLGQGDPRQARRLYTEASRLDPVNQAYRKRLSEITHQNLHDIYRQSSLSR